MGPAVFRGAAAESLQRVARLWKHPGIRILALGAVAIAMVATGLAYQLVTDYRAIRRSAEAEARSYAHLLREHVGRTVDAAALSLVRVARATAGRDWDEVGTSYAQWLELRVLADELPQVRSMWLADDRGAMRLYSDRFPTPALDVSDRDYFRAHGASRSSPFVGAPMAGGFTGRTYFPVSVPIRSDGRVTGVAVAAIEPAYYLPLIEGLDGCTGCRLAVARTDGVVLVEAFAGGRQAEAPRTMVGGLALHDVEPRVLEGADPLRLGHPHVAAVAPLVDLPLATVVDIPRAALLRLWAKTAVPLAFIGAVSVALLALLTVSSARRTTHERRRSQELELAREAAEQANRAKTMFLANMSHELRTPLNAIIGFAEVIRDERITRDTRRIRGYAADIHTAGSHLLGIVNDLLDLARIEAGKVVLRPEPVSIREVVAVALSAIRPQAEATGVRLAADHDRLDAEVMADERSLRQVLINLLSNAVKFTPVAGSVAVATRVEDGRVLFEVSDTGIGIPSDAQDRVLRPFEQVESHLSRIHDGAGLGLPIAKRLAELQGGTLSLVSVPGQGTTVTVALPAATPRPEAAFAG